MVSFDIRTILKSGHVHFKRYLKSFAIGPEEKFTQI